MKLQDHKNLALQKHTFKKEYANYDLAFEIGQMVLEARLLKGVTQQKLAEKLGTKQPSVARLENGQGLPSLTFLEKVARALGTHLLAPRFAFLEEPVEQNSRFINTMIITATPIEEAKKVYPLHSETKSPSYSQSLSFAL